ncbi:MAG: hypothetical protein ACE5KU_04305 [Nitrososphaerales archaeon]
MAADPNLILFEDLLYLVGAFIGFSVAYVSYHGYRDTESPTMLRLSIAFLLLGGGFTLSGIVGLASLGVLPYITLVISVLVLGAGLLEAAGYFFLAFSHIMNVRGFEKAGAASPITLSAAVPVAALKSVSLYFLLYGVIETVIAYFRVRRFETLTIAIGLGMIASAEFIRWTSFLYPSVAAILVVSLVVKIMGFSTLYVPVVKFASLGGRLS